jgi:hypothetical protein
MILQRLFDIEHCTRNNYENRKDLDRRTKSGCYREAPGPGVGVGVGVTFRPGEPSGVGLGVAVAVGVGLGVGLGLMSVGPFGVAVGVGLGVGAKSGVGETVGVGVGEELCAKALRGGKTQPAIARNNKQANAATARTSIIFALINRTTKGDAA